MSNEMTVDEFIEFKMTWDKMPYDKMVLDKITVDNLPWHHS